MKVGNKMNEVIEMVLKFKQKYPWTIGFRTRRHCEIIQLHLNPGERVFYAFTAQKNDTPFDVFTSCVVALTNKRILIAQKRLVFGYFFYAITPDMFNDLKVKMGLVWGKVYIDTIKELVILSNISRKALPEIETKITQYMMREKKKYGKFKKTKKNLD
jgi:hypothetical protein